MTNRKYVSIAHNFAPFEGAYYLSGLGDAGASNAWPKGRSYWGIQHFRAPYRAGYFQDNNLMGLGGTGDVFTVLRQIPTWAYAGAGAVLLGLAYKKYKGA